MTTAKKKADEKHARYLVNPDTNHVELVHADDVEDRQGKGWKDPEGKMANGADWNSEELQEQANAAADQAKVAADAKAEKDAKQAEEAEKARAEAEKNAPQAQPKADMRVEVVQHAAEPKSKK